MAPQMRRKSPAASWLLPDRRSRRRETHPSAAWPWANPPGRRFVVGLREAARPICAGSRVASWRREVMRHLRRADRDRSDAQAAGLRQRPLGSADNLGQIDCPRGHQQHRADMAERRQRPPSIRRQGSRAAGPSNRQARHGLPGQAGRRPTFEPDRFFAGHDHEQPAATPAANVAHQRGGQRSAISTSFAAPSDRPCRDASAG